MNWKPITDGDQKVDEVQFRVIPKFAPANAQSELYIHTAFMGPDVTVKKEDVLFYLGSFGASGTEYFDACVWNPKTEHYDKTTSATATWIFSPYHSTRSCSSISICSSGLGAQLT